MNCHGKSGGNDLPSQPGGKPGRSSSLSWSWGGQLCLGHGLPKSQGRANFSVKSSPAHLVRELPPLEEPVVGASIHLLYLPGTNKYEPSGLQTLWRGVLTGNWPGSSSSQAVQWQRDEGPGC